MDFSLSQEQQMLKTSARDFLETECPEKLVRDMEEDKKGYSPELWKKIADLGWLGLIYPEEYDGTGGSILDMAVLCEELGRAMLPGPFLSTVVLCGLTILDAGSKEQKKAMLPKIVNGDLVLSLAMTEPQACWDGNQWEADGITVTATAAGDNYIINGTKLFVWDALAADQLLVVARTRKTGRAESGITLFLVDAKSPGIKYTVLRTTAGDKRQTEVTFNKVKTPKKNMVGALNGGWAPLARAMKVGAVLLSAEMVGAGEIATDLSVDYAKTRVQFDLPIGINQWVQEHCVWGFADYQGTRNLVYEAAWMLSEGIPCDLQVAMAKARANDAIEDALWRSQQVLAGVGFTTQDGVLPLYVKRALAQKHYLGDTDYHLDKVAQVIEKWPEPEKPRGKRLGIFDTPEDLQVPAWDVWRNQTKGKLW